MAGSQKGQRKGEKKVRSNQGQLLGGGEFPVSFFPHQEKTDYPEPHDNQSSPRLPVHSKNSSVVTNEDK